VLPAICIVRRWNLTKKIVELVLKENEGRLSLLLSWLGPRRGRARSQARMSLALTALSLAVLVLVILLAVLLFPSLETLLVQLLTSVIS
jgi:hypothetical protein